jgi:predicted DNA-binding transcriptional regulator AlpA
MKKLSTGQVARKLGIRSNTLSRYITSGKISAPPEIMAGGMRMRLWSDSDIEKLREALPKVKNGRKTRYQKLREKQAQARVPVPDKPGQTKKKK